MAIAVARRADNALKNEIAPLRRDEVLARYRHLREISKRHHDEILSSISVDALLQQARRLGLARGRTLILDDMDEMTYVYDLVIHTTPAGRSRAIGRFCRSAQLAEGSDEALVLAAMRAARFSILAVKGRHEAAGLIATDVFRRTEIWLVDIGLESCLPAGAVIATRLFTPEGFSLTAGVNVPFNPAVAAALDAELPRCLGEKKRDDMIDDRRFAETTYRVAIAGGIMDRVTYQDLPDDA